MTQKRQIGDPFEQAVTTGKIGKRQTANNSNTQTPESSNFQTSEHLNIQTPETPNFQTSESSTTQTSGGSKVQTSKHSKDQMSKSPKVQRPKHRGREQQTIYLPPHLVRKLKVHKALHDKEYSDIVAEALEEYFQTHQN